GFDDFAGEGGALAHTGDDRKALKGFDCFLLAGERLVEHLYLDVLGDPRPVSEIHRHVLIVVENCGPNHAQVLSLRPEGSGPRHLRHGLAKGKGGSAQRGLTVLRAPGRARAAPMVPVASVGADRVACHLTPEIREEVAERDEGAGEQRNCGTRYSQYGATHDASPTSTARGRILSAYSLVAPTGGQVHGVR